MSAGTGAERRRGRVHFGRVAETWVAVLLVLSGWRIIARRFCAAGGEIDIAARRGDVLCIVEVKARQNERDALEALGEPQRRRIVAAARALVAAHPGLARLSVRFDVVAVAPWGRTAWVRGAFREDGR